MIALKNKIRIKRVIETGESDLILIGIVFRISVNRQGIVWRGKRDRYRGSEFKIVAIGGRHLNLVKTGFF